LARIDDYKESFRLASETLERADLQLLARLAGADLKLHEKGGAEIRFAFLQTDMLITVGDQVDVTKDGEEGEPSLPEKILVLHYFLHASGKPASGELITFRQIPDGQFYFDAFQRRARDPFLATFGRDAELFRSCARMIGGIPVDAGDVGMAFRVLPHITIRLALWQGDDEFPPEASVLFEDNIQHYLDVEDIAVLSGMLVYRLMGIARGLQQAGVK
jgi:hypothetical protein